MPSFIFYFQRIKWLQTTDQESYSYLTSHIFMQSWHTVFKWRCMTGLRFNTCLKHLFWNCSRLVLLSARETCIETKAVSIKAQSCINLSLNLWQIGGRSCWQKNTIGTKMLHNIIMHVWLTTKTFIDNNQNFYISLHNLSMNFAPKKCFIAGKRGISYMKYCFLKYFKHQSGQNL